MKNRTFLCSNYTGIVCRVIGTIERDGIGSAFEVQLPSGDRLVIEPSETDTYNVLPDLFSLELGRIVATPGVLEAMSRSRQSPEQFLAIHQIGDWGSIDKSDRRENEIALKTGARLLSAYVLNDGTKIYVITEAVGDEGTRESTCILLPEEY